MMNSKIALLAVTAILVVNAAVGFAPTTTSRRPGTASAVMEQRQQQQQRQPLSSTTALQMANNDDLLRWARSSRSASVDDNLVELKRPIGVVLAEDDDGNVFVETLAPNGNAARSGKVKEGDLVTMCSATFGDDMWSTRGVGLTRVLAAIRVRSGSTVKLVFESRNQSQKKAAMTTKQKEAMEAARKSAQQQKDRLLKELERDEKKLKKGKFLGLF